MRGIGSSKSRFFPELVPLYQEEKKSVRILAVCCSVLGILIFLFGHFGIDVLNEDSLRPSEAAQVGLISSGVAMSFLLLDFLVLESRRRRRFARVRRYPASLSFQSSNDTHCVEFEFACPEHPRQRWRCVLLAGEGDGVLRGLDGKSLNGEMFFDPISGKPFAVSFGEQAYKISGARTFSVP